MTAATRAAHAFFAKAGDRRSHGSVGAANQSLVRALERCGYHTTVHSQRRRTPMQALLPLDLAAERVALMATSPADLAFYDDGGLALCAPGRRWARRSAVFYHGLAYNPGTWIANDAIDLHIANSPYLARVLRSILSFPDWERRRCLDPRAFAKVVDVALALPCVEHPDGTDRMGGADVPAEVRALLESGAVVGHALQFTKQDFAATVSILFHLGEIAREAGTPEVRLLVSDVDWTPSTIATLDEVLAPLGKRAADLYVPVPILSQRALFQVMRACAFGLSFTNVPESFGFYAPESVWNGCPVFTNGLGNTRHVLPPGHGIHVFDDVGPTEDSGPYESVALAIHHALADRAARAEECRRGAAYIAAHHGPDALERDLAAALARLDVPAPPPLDLEAARIELGPLVHRWSPGSGVVACDVGTLALSSAQAAALPELLGRTGREVPAGSALAAAAGELFAAGILSLAAPA